MLRVVDGHLLCVIDGHPYGQVLLCVIDGHLIVIQNGQVYLLFALLLAVRSLIFVIESSVKNERFK
ncbi:MAG: hypothetical protein B6D64_09605, partial [Bacteroidetes bacterium 4484_276]